MVDLAGALYLICLLKGFLIIILANWVVFSKVFLISLVSLPKKNISTYEDLYVDELSYAMP